VVDGDTVHADVPGRGEVKVRLIGIDTPETHKPQTSVQCFGPGATRATEALLPLGTRVTAAFEREHRTDRYGRDLWDVWLPDGRFLNGVLVAAGAAVARSYPPTTDHAAYLLAEQQAARAAGLGLWSSCPADQIPRHD
jgi:micrococcal nuclease